MPPVAIPPPIDPVVQKAQMVARYEDLTATEIVGNVQWFRLSSGQQFNEAFRVLQVSLDVEHFIATMPLDSKDFTDLMIAEAKELRDQQAAISGIFVRLNCLNENKPGDQKAFIQAMLASIESGTPPTGA